MNPILRMLKPSKGSQSKTNADLFQLVNDVKSGKVDPKQKSLDIIKSMTSEQKQAINQILPNFLKLGKVFGVSDKNINQFTTELKECLQGRN